jgi:signal transduction histidine kinase
MPKLQRKPSQLNHIVRSVLNLYTGKQMPDFEQQTESIMTNSRHEDSGLQDSTDKFWLENVSKIKVETKLAPVPQLSLDPEQIAQALGNLFKNAIESMPDGGMLKVSTYFTPDPLQASLDGNLRSPVKDGKSGEPHDSESRAEEEKRDMDVQGIVSLEIQDTGRGMSEETMANLFVPYYTTKSETNGTGLGMPIVKRIVTEHGAEMECQSTEDVGTTVRIRFPYNPDVRSGPPPVTGEGEELAAE